MAFWSKKTDDKVKPQVAEDPKPASSGRSASAKIAIPTIEPTKSMQAPAPAASNGVATQPPASPVAPANAVAATASQAPPVAPQLSVEDSQKRAIASKRLLMSFGEIVSVLMRNPQFRSMPLSEVETLVVPAVLKGQFLLVEAQSKTSGFVTAVAAALWARVSPEVDSRIAQNIERPFKLLPDEWSSGDIPWLVVLAGDPRVMGPALKQLQDTTLKGRPLKMPVRTADGKIVVGGVEQLLAAPARVQA